MKVHIVCAECDDWMRVYKDGVCVHDGHGISGEEMLRTLGIDFTMREIGDDEMASTTAKETAP